MLTEKAEPEMAAAQIRIRAARMTARRVKAAQKTAAIEDGETAEAAALKAQSREVKDRVQMSVVRRHKMAVRAHMVQMLQIPVPAAARMVMCRRKDAEDAIEATCIKVRRAKLNQHVLRKCVFPYIARWFYPVGIP